MAKNQATKPAEPGTNVAVKDEVDGEMIIVSDQVPEHLKDAIGSNRGSENVSNDDLIVPRLEILQAISPQLTEGDPAYIPGAKAGDLINSVTNVIYGKQVPVIPVHFQKLYLVWLDRQKGGGFRGAFKDEPAAQERANAEGGKAAGFEVIDTPTHLCLLPNVSTGKFEEIMIAMPRTKAKISRQWNTMIKLANKARFAMAYEVGTVLQKNTQGDFYNFAIQPMGYTPKHLFDRAVALYEAINKGDRTAKMDLTGLNPEDHGEEVAGGPSKM